MKGGPLLRAVGNLDLAVQVSGVRDSQAYGLKG